MKKIEIIENLPLTVSLAPRAVVGIEMITFQHNRIVPSCLCR